MKAQKFSEEIVKVSVIPDFYDHFLGTNRDGLVTLLSREDGSISYPHLFGIKFEEFNGCFFYFKDKNNLEFLVEFSTGKIVTLDNFKSLVKDNNNVSHEEIVKMNEFYLDHWAALNNEYYIYTDLSTHLKSLVKKDTLDTKLKNFSDMNYYFSDNDDIVTILQKNGKQKLYNLKTNSFFEMNEYLIINPIFKTPFILIGNNKNELRLYRIKGDIEIKAIFDNPNLYVSENDIIRLRNGKILINVNKEVYMV